MENPVNYFGSKVYEHLVAQGGKDRTARRIVRFHTDNLEDCGDVSFPAAVDIWKKFLEGQSAEKLPKNVALLEAAEEGDGADFNQSLINDSKNWRLHVEKVVFVNKRCLIFLERKTLITQVLHQVLKGDGTNYGQLKKDVRRRIRLLELAEQLTNENNLSFYRAKIVRETLARILSYSNWVCAQEDEQDCGMLKLAILSTAAMGNSAVVRKEPNTAAIICGIVTDAKGKGIADMTTQQYMSTRAIYLRQTALHRSGVRPKDSEGFSTLLQRLGKASVTVDLLEVKESSPARIILNGVGCTKGAAFILYNSARLETLLRTFNERMDSSGYGPLPPIEDVDLTLLRSEEDWKLIMGFLFTFPNLIEESVDQLRAGKAGTHLIIQYLSRFASAFSVYYQRVKILMEFREHLMPIIYARIYLIKAVREVFNKTLGLIDIEPVEYM